jgi:hypothetical protein
MDSKAFKRKREIRRMLLDQLVKDILAGKYNNVQESTESTYPLHSNRTERHVPRGEYKGPRDRDTYNYGYTEIDELTGLHAPNVWE